MTCTNIPRPRCKILFLQHTDLPPRNNIRTPLTLNKTTLRYAPWAVCKFFLLVIRDLKYQPRRTLSTVSWIPSCLPAFKDIHSTPAFAAPHHTQWDLSSSYTAKPAPPRRTPAFFVSASGRANQQPPPMHHHRRKSGHASGNSSMTDVRKSATTSSSRPTAMTRRTTSQSAQKLGKSPRDREREWEEERWWDEERDSFPQYWYVFLALSLAFCWLYVS